MLETGHSAPFGTLYDSDEREVKIASLTEAGPVLLAFFKVSCPICQLTLPFLERLSTLTSAGVLRIFGVSQDDPVTTSKFCQRFGVTMPMLYDSEEHGFPVSNAFRITNVPSMFVIEPDGRISWDSTGFSKKEMNALAGRMSAVLFRPDENVPEWKAG